MAATARLSRRDLLLRSSRLGAGLVLAGASAEFLSACGSVAPPAARALAASDAPAWGLGMVALPGKNPLIQVYDRPPNYETPTPHLIGSAAPYTDAKSYYVRYREASVPEIRPDSFRLQVGGDAVAQPMSFSFSDLQQLGELEMAAVGECTGEGRGLLQPLVPGLPWHKGDLGCALWRGAPLKAVLEKVGVKDSAKQVAFKSAGRTIALSAPDYWRAYPVDVALSGRALLAYQMNGAAMPLWNGYPLRLVVPGTYAPHWVKQVVQIEVRSTPIGNLWAASDTNADRLRLMSLVTTPADGTSVPAGAPLTLTGVAYDDGTGIAKVEVSVDNGRTWQQAQLDKPVAQYAWRIWHFRFTPAGTGALQVLTRATNVKGVSQPMDVDQAKLLADPTKTAKRNNAVRTFAARLQAV